MSSQNDDEEHFVAPWAYPGRVRTPGCQIDYITRTTMLAVTDGVLTAI